MKPYLRHILKLSLKHKALFWGLMLIIVVEVAVRLAQPYLYKVVVDALSMGLSDPAGFTKNLTQLLMSTILIWMLLSIGDNLLRAQMLFMSWKIGNKTSAEVHLSGFRKLLQLDYQRHTKTHSSQLAKIVDNADVSLWEMSNWWLSSFLPAGLGFVGMLVIAFSVSWKMTIVSVAVVPAYLLLVKYVFAKTEDDQHKLNKLWDAKHEHMSDQLSNIITYKLNPDEDAFFHKQKAYSDIAVEKQFTLNKRWRFIEMLNPDAVARFMVMGFGVLLVKDGSISLGTMFMFMGLLNEILIPLHILGEKIPQYSRRARQIDKYLKLMEEIPSVQDPATPLTLKHSLVKGRLEFKNVSYRYKSDGKDSVKNLNFIIEPGEHVALVGQSGAGKSTLMALLVRLMDPTEGEILLDGVDIKNYAQAEYRNLIGVVQQENMLYRATIAENIAYGKLGASRKKILEAARIAAADDFIKLLPDGYETEVGERGVRLSGGEKQRLAIARAILKNPKFVILDEPTSALDSVTESKVQAGLNTLIQGRSSLTIAHRLSTVRDSDKIIVMGQGKIINFGSHQELMQSCANYREMVELQTEGFLADD